jgi:RNA polymerase sigma-70 factor (ECF subfamily)
MSDSERSAEFVRLLTASSGPVFGFILSLVPRWADAEEIFQETCRSSWQRFEEFKPGTNFTAWVCRDARFRVLEARKRSQRDPMLLSDLLENDIIAAAEEDLGERHAALMDCLQKLNPRDRHLLASRYWDDMKPAEIAQQDNLTVSTIHKALSRIRHALFICVDRTLRKEAH